MDNIFQLIGSPFLVLFGLISITTSAFSKLYILIHVTLTVLILFFTRQSDVATRTIRSIVLFTFGIGVLLSWLVLWGSYQSMPPINEVTYGDVLAKAGFPFHTFNYPYPPMGGDEPPISTWAWFYANEVFWLAAAAGVVTIFKKNLLVSKRWTIVIGIAAPYFSLWGLGYLLFKFD